MAALVMLVIEFGLGMWVNLYAQLPDGDKGAGMASGFGRAVADGPVGLGVHAVVGVLLTVAAISVLVRSLLLRRPALIALAAVGVLAILMSATSGARFVGDGDNASSMSMAIGAGVAILSYAVMLFVSAPSPYAGSEAAATSPSS